MNLKFRIEAAFVRTGLKIGNLFPWRMISDSGAFWGWTAFHIFRVRRTATLRNLRMAFGDRYSEEELQSLASRCFVNFGRTFMEYFALPAFHKRNIMQRIEYEGEEHMQAALAGGKGVLFLAAHFGNWEVAAIATSKLGVPLHTVVGDLANPVVDEVVNNLRESLGLIVDRRRMGLRAVLRALKQGHGIGIQADQEARWNGIPVPFFGMTSLTHPGTAWFSLKTGAPILQAYALRVGNGFRVVYEPPIWPNAEATDEEVLKLTALHTARLENLIRRYPDQWFWLHKRWKRAPRGEDGLPLRAGPLPSNSDTDE
ncbi:MAG: lysophospholipid acyltransferase family protein [bacterium]|nr:lysophospholipid acyltransferase family protein [bacterium]